MASTHTPVLFNAAKTAMVAALQFQRPATDIVSADYNTIVSAADTFATALDAALATQSALTSAPNVTILPSAAVSANALSSLPPLMYQIVYSYFSGRSLQNTSADTTASTYATPVAVCNAQYLAASTTLSIT